MSIAAKCDCGKEIYYCTGGEGCRWHNMTFPEIQAERIRGIDFNDRKILLDLIEYTRNAGYGYGITAILEKFLDNQQFLSTIKPQ